LKDYWREVERGKDIDWVGAVGIGLEEGSSFFFLLTRVRRELEE
jgi:hypothetical protein